MHVWRYPAVLTKGGEGDFVVTFPDIPEAITGGTTEAAARGGASDALAAAVDGLLRAGRLIPMPRKAEGDEFQVTLDMALAARAALANAMRQGGLTNVALARRMGRDEKIVRRALSGKGASLDLISQALAAAGAEPALATG